MMSSENIPPPSQPPDHNHTTTARKPAPPQEQQQQQQQAPLKCPRCDSSNTKFCYYNNYSLTQPRHFCKTCRRYWTKGGALRNVPIGGGCRKAKRHKPSPSSSCPTPSSASLSAGPGGAEFRFLAPPIVTPAMEFQLGGISLPRLHPATAGVYTQFVTSSGAHPQSTGVGPGPGGCFSLDLLGMGNYPPIPNSRSSPSSNSSSLSLAGGAAVIGGDHTISSIESLSSINQEMHWKLQQQRLAMIYGPSPVEQDDSQQQEKSLGGGGTNLFKNLECNKKVVDVTPTEWLFDQIHSNSSANYDNDASNHNIATNNNHNNHEDFNGVWTTELHHHHQFNGLQ